MSLRRYRCYACAGEFRPLDWLPGLEPWLQHTVAVRERAFPTAVELLDWYHLSEQLRFGVGRQHEAVMSTASGAAGPGDVDALLAIPRSHARSLGPTIPSRPHAA